MQRLGTRRVRALMIVVVVLLLSASAALALSSRVQPGKSLAVHDASGRLVGQVVDLEGNGAVVVVEIGELPVALRVNRSQFGPAGFTVSGGLYFESADCTGPGFLAVFPDPDHLFPVVSLTGTRIYSLVGPEQTVQARSTLLPEDVCEQVEFDIGAQAANLLADLALEFQPPFSLRVN